MIDSHQIVETFAGLCNNTSKIDETEFFRPTIIRSYGKSLLVIDRNGTVIKEIDINTSKIL